MVYTPTHASININERWFDASNVPFLPLNISNSGIKIRKYVSSSNFFPSIRKLDNFELYKEMYVKLILRTYRHVLEVSLDGSNRYSQIFRKFSPNEEETFIQLCPRFDLPRFKPCVDIFHPYSPIESSLSASLSFTCVYTPVEEREPP